jgi:hypothetical protein
MALTENAMRVYLATNMGNVAINVDNYEQFNSQWCAKIIMLSISTEEEDKKTMQAMQNTDSYHFYIDATNN